MNDIETMDHDTAAGTLRRLEFEDEGDPTERLALAKRALETSPPEWRHVWRKRAEIYQNGRWVRVKRMPVEPFDAIDLFGEEFGKEES